MGMYIMSYVYGNLFPCFKEYRFKNNFKKCFRMMSPGIFFPLQHLKSKIIPEIATRKFKKEQFFTEYEIIDMSIKCTVLV